MEFMATPGDWKRAQDSPMVLQFELKRYWRPSKTLITSPASPSTSILPLPSVVIHIFWAITTKKLSSWNAHFSSEHVKFRFGAYVFGFAGKIRRGQHMQWWENIIPATKIYRSAHPSTFPGIVPPGKAKENHHFHVSGQVTNSRVGFQSYTPFCVKFQVFFEGWCFTEVLPISVNLPTVFPGLIVGACGA